MKKAIIQSFETIAVLLFFFILLVIGLVFYGNYSNLKLEKKYQEMLSERAFKIALLTRNLPELICTKQEAEPEPNCLDKVKLKRINETTSQNHDFYFSLFGFSHIYVEEKTGEKLNYTIYYNPRNTTQKPNKNFFILSLADPIKSNNITYTLGVLNVIIYPERD